MKKPTIKIAYMHKGAPAGFYSIEHPNKARPILYVRKAKHATKLEADSVIAALADFFNNNSL